MYFADYDPCKQVIMDRSILSKIVYCRNRTFYENFKLKLCGYAQNQALGTPTKFQQEILTINMISGIVYSREIVLVSSRDVSETTPGISVYRDVIYFLINHLLYLYQDMCCYQYYIHIYNKKLILYFPFFQ